MILKCIYNSIEKIKKVDIDYSYFYIYNYKVAQKIAMKKLISYEGKNA